MDIDSDTCQALALSLEVEKAKKEENNDYSAKIGFKEGLCFQTKDF